MILNAAIAEAMDDDHLIAVAHTEASTVLEYELLSRFEALVDRATGIEELVEACGPYSLDAATIEHVFSAHSADPDTIAALLGALSDAEIADVAALHRILYPATGTPDGRPVSPTDPESKA